ncbi:MAG: RidA family protein, partial [Acidobacteriota bacterium]
MRKKTLTAFFVLSMFLVCVTCAQSREAIQLDDYLTELPFSPGIVAGEMLYLSGAVGVRPGQQKPEGDISRQTEVTLENLGLVLRKAGLDFADVVSATVYLADARHYSEMNEVYRRFFPQNPPARATVEGAVVVKDALVEISAIAVKKGVARRYLTPASWPQPAAPFSWGVLVGEKVLFLSGLVGSEPASGAFESDFTLQTRQVFQNMGALLKAAEMDFADLVSTRVYLSDSRDFAARNDVYTDVLPEQRPVRATVQARLANPG